MPSYIPVTKPASRNKEKSSQRRSAPAIVNEVISSPGRSLEDNTRTEMERRFNHDFSKVRIHTDERAVDSAESVNALAYTIGNHIVFDQGQYVPGTEDGRQTLRHELTHVIQQHGAGFFSSVPMGTLNDSAEYEAEKISKAAVLGTDCLQPTARQPLTLMRQPRSLQTIPLNERRAIQVSTMSVTVPSARIVAFFRLMPSGNPGERRSVGATHSYSTNITAGLHVGLASVGAWIQGDTNALPLNSSIEVDLDLSSHGGSHSTYRFTYFSHTTTNRGRRATTSNVMLIELVGNVVAAPAGQAAPANSFTIGTTSFNLSGAWSNSEYGVLRQALTLLPARALTDAAGVTCRKSGSSSAGEAGEYNQTSDTISLHNNAFPTSSLRVGQRLRGAHNILHEIGHALDLRVLQRAWNTFNQAGQTPAARRTFLRQRSLSGTRYVVDASGGGYQDDQAVADTSGLFRQAAGRDQVRRETGTRTTTAGTTATLRGGITSYSDTDYQELFAETFALYINAPETLRQLRPNIYNYFNSRYPRPRTP